MRFQTIDAHTGGEPLRLIVDGWPEPQGRTILEKREYARRKQDHLRRVLMFEPRGHADMYGALLTKPERADSDTGVLFMHNEGYSLMCGHGIIALTKILIERKMMPGPSITYDAPAGQIKAHYAGGNVSFYSNPKFDSLVVAARREIDESKRNALYKQADSVAFVDAPMLFLYFYNDLYAVQPWLKGFRPPVIFNGQRWTTVSIDSVRK